jgi:cytidylate kinase
MYQIAIDGPSGAGKSSLAKAVAKELGIVYVDTGALYRTVGYYVLQKGLKPKDAASVEAVLCQISIELKFENGTQYVYLNGENLGDKIRRPEISMAASAVSAIPAVRAFLLETQKSIARTHSVIMDGRDIGTVILPQADVKIFLFASDEARALRRTKELAEKGMPADYEDVLRQMRQRDAQDRGREVAPAVPAPDAIMFDNSDLTVEGSVEKLLEIVRERVPEAR